MFIIFQTLRKILVFPLLVLTIITSPAAVSTDTAQLESTHTFVFDQALLTGQGITNDGEYFYTSGSVTAVNFTSISKFTIDDMVLVDTNINPLPGKCVARGNNHIGGISHYNGKIYASVEGGDECYACIVVFDCETLKPTGEVYDLPNDKYYDGVPWCAVDPDTGYLYASAWSNAEFIYVYDVNNSMKFIRSIDLSGLEKIDRIQGGEFFDGTLYLSCDIKNNGNIKNILSVDIKTDEVNIAAQRNVGGEKIEAEGMTFLPDSTMCVLDYNKIIGVFLHRYKVSF